MMPFKTFVAIAPIAGVVAVAFIRRGACNVGGDDPPVAHNGANSERFSFELIEGPRATPAHEAYADDQHGH